MAFKDLLLQLSSYPESTPAAPIEQAIDFAKSQGAHITALPFKVEIPRVGNPLANALLDIPGMIAAEREKSGVNARNMVSLFEAMARKHGVAHQHIIESCPTSQLASIVTGHARMHDVTLIPIGENLGLQQYVAECVVFGAGRPTIVLPEAPRHTAPLALDNICVAWDFSRPAARALADALPILERAKTVRVVTITEEEMIDTKRSGAELAKHLARHGIEVVLDEEGAAGRTIGEALEEYSTAHKIDLLVMGAFGHSRLRDFILGGATKTVIAHPKLPVLLSH